MIIEGRQIGNFYLLHCSNLREDKEVLSELSKYAIAKGLATENHTSAILEREIKYPTGLNAQIGIAIPHAELENTIQESVVIALLEQPVKFKTMGGGEDTNAEIVFMLMVKNPENHMKLLEHIVKLIQDKSFIDKLNNEDKYDTLVSEFTAFFKQDRFKL